MNDDEGGKWGGRCFSLPQVRATDARLTVIAIGLNAAALTIDSAE